MRPSASLDRRTRLLLLLLLLSLTALTVYRLFVAPTPGPYVELSGPTMGTTYMVKIAAELDPSAQRRVATAIDARLDRVNQLMSSYDPESELSRFNRHRQLTPFPASPETLEIFRIAREVSEWSGGAFDVTVAPLVRAWGFGAGGREAAKPTARELRELLALVAYDGIVVDTGAGVLRKAVAEMECDLSAIAKGYAVDRLAETLKQVGYDGFLVEIGGELRASGRRLDGKLWRVAVERPDSPQRRTHEIVALENASIATSGDYRNYYVRDGVRVSHTIDPRTGEPIRHRLASVSVIHPEAVYADALATALSVLGPEEGYALAEQLRLAAYFIVRSSRVLDQSVEGEEFVSRATPAFEQVLADSLIASQAP
jgi:thiamine biosynthesis lipoprotein